MNISRAKQQELKEIEGTIEDIVEQVDRLSRLINAQPDLSIVSGAYDMRTDVGVLHKALDELKGTLYHFGLDYDFMGWKHIK
jgi:hypothetical protein